MNSVFLLYGANGYSGELILRHANEYGLTPVLAGRSKEKIKPLAEKYGFRFEIFDVNENEKLRQVLSQYKVVMNTAGPFDRTAKQMVEGCLDTGTQYLDINGDIGVFEMIKSYNEAAKQKGVMLLPGTGFDVIPTDCLSLFANQKLSTAYKLEIAFATIGGGLSHGTATTVSQKLGQKGNYRINGNITPIPLGKHAREIEIFGKKFFMVSIPWGDISTAYFTTGIPNIETFTGMPKSAFYLLKFQAIFNPLLRTKIIKNFVQKRIDSGSTGPPDEQRKKATAYVWVCASDEKGNHFTATLKGPEGYTTTYHASLNILKKVLQGNYQTGYQTPATAYGPNLILEVPFTERTPEN